MSSIDMTSDSAARDRPANVLFILSGATYWVLKDGTRYATGCWAEEFANPYKVRSSSRRSSAPPR